MSGQERHISAWLGGGEVPHLPPDLVRIAELGTRREHVGPGQLLKPSEVCETQTSPLTGPAQRALAGRRGWRIARGRRPHAAQIVEDATAGIEAFAAVAAELAARNGDGEAKLDASELGTMEALLPDEAGQ
jgi:hypothetical protein